MTDDTGFVGGSPGESPFPSDVTAQAGTINESGQLDVVALVREEVGAADSALVDIEDTLNPQIDANPNDTLLMEMLVHVSDARESVDAIRDLLGTIERRDSGGA